MSVPDTLRLATAELEAAGCASPRVDAELLLGHVLGLTRTELYLDGEGGLAPPEAEQFRELLARRAGREPLAYILGEWGFRRLTLKVDRRVLVPRPETEILVERGLALLADVSDPRVLDVGVGSGAIALAVADERPDARVVATDRSADALAVAAENARRTGLEERVELVHADLLAGVEGPFDLVVSNPPYVAPEELESLEPEVRLFEPREAFVGVGVAERVAREALHVLRPGGALVLETGDGQAPSVADTLGQLGFEAVTITKDLADRERVVEGRWHGG